MHYIWWLFSSTHWNLLEFQDDYYVRLSHAGYAISFELGNQWRRGGRKKNMNLRICKVDAALGSRGSRAVSARMSGHFWIWFVQLIRADTGCHHGLSHHPWALRRPDSLVALVQKEWDFSCTWPELNLYKFFPVLNLIHNESGTTAVWFLPNWKQIFLK